MNFAAAWRAVCRRRSQCGASVVLLACTFAPVCVAQKLPQQQQASSAARGGDTADEFAAGPDAVVLNGKIVSISPPKLTAGAPLMITVNVWLARPLSAAALERNLRVFIDSVPLASTVSEALVSSSASGLPVASMPAASPASGVAASAVVTRAVTLMVTAPNSLASDSSFNLSVYSTLDRREVTATEVRSAVAQGFVQDLLGGRGDALKIAFGVAAAIAGLLLVGYRLSKLNVQRIRSLQHTIELERRRVDDLGRVLETEAPASAGPADPYPPVMPPEVLSALELRDLVVVIGMGVSAQSGLPISRRLWLNIIDRQASRLSPSHVESLRAMIVNGDTDTAAEAIISLLGRDTVQRDIAAELQDQKPQPSRLHRLLASLPMPALIDMTWDDLMSQALVDKDIEVVGPAQGDSIATLLRGGKMALIKPLGALRLSVGVALTEREYRVALSRAPELERAIAALFSTRTLLFLGFSLDGIEQFLTNLPAHLDSSGRKHFAVVPTGSSMAGLWQAGQGSRFGVNLIEYRPSPDFREVVAAAEKLAEQVSRIGKVSRTDGAGMSLAATRLTHLQLESIGIFRTLRVEFSPGWTLLLGNNGGGKSTILRAVALALAGNDPRAAAAGARMLRSGETLGTIELGMGSIRVGTSLVRDGHQVLIRSPQTTALQAGQILVLAFPALRGVLAAQIKGPTSVLAANPSVDDVAPLLAGTVDSRLDNLQQWVVNTALRAESAPTGREMQMLQTFRQLIADMVPGGGLKFARVDRKTWQVVLEADHGEVQFDSVSQGMSAILNWIGVLLQRLYDVYPHSPRPEHEPAIVLVDEIDAHLHPEWQRRLVALTRKHFPNVQVIASSHSPLLAGAVAHAELRVVARDDQSGQIRADMPREDLSGQKADDILVSSLFSLQTTRSIEAEQTIRRYFDLFQKPLLSAAEKTELDALALQVKALNFGPPRAMREPMDDARSAVDQALAAISTASAQALQQKLSSAPAGESQAP